jgi:hypothetical protein
VKCTVSIVAAVLSIAAGSAAFATELPTYERTGFPISPVQLQLLGLANVAERSPTATVAASPHQLHVLTTRPAPHG